MDRIVEVLLEKESMTGDEFRALLAQFAQVRAALGGGALLVLCCPWVTSRVRWPLGLPPGPAQASRQPAQIAGSQPSLPSPPQPADRPARLIASPLQIPQENLDAVARQKQPDAELQLA